MKQSSSHRAAALIALLGCGRTFAAVGCPVLLAGGGRAVWLSVSFLLRTGARFCLAGETWTLCYIFSTSGLKFLDMDLQTCVEVSENPFRGVKCGLPNCIVAS